MSTTPRRFPAEWERQSGVLIAWPHAGTDWAQRLAEVETTYVALAKAVTQFQPLVICTANAALRTRAANMLREAGVDLSRLRFVEVEYDDTWLRDSGPISLIDGDGFELLDFRFTGWGGKYEAGRDDALVSGCFQQQLFSPSCKQRVLQFALEGGAIETDGAGSLMTTWTCLSHRHPELPRAEIEQRLCDYLQQDRVLMLDRGHLEGDDTDAHIDTLARFCPNDTIVYQGCDDESDSHYIELGEMRDQLARFRTREGEPYRLLELPWARPVVDDGRRLAASYANFLIINGAVLMPGYDDPADVLAQQELALAFPEREIIIVPCRPLIWQNGSLHCITMQLPNGVLNG